MCRMSRHSKHLCACSTAFSDAGSRSPCPGTRKPCARFPHYLCPMARPTPYDLFLAPIADESFPRIRASLAAAGVDPADRDAFLMDREVVTLIRQLRGDEA